MEPTRLSFAHHPLRWPPHARRDIYGRGERPAGFTPENRFGAGGKRGFYWSQSQAGLAVQPFFGLGFRLRWSGSAMEGLPVLARVLPVLVYVLSVLARVLSVLARVLPVLARVLPVLARVLSINLGESARISRFGKRHREANLVDIEMPRKL